MEQIIIHDNVIDTQIVISEKLAGNGSTPVTGLALETADTKADISPSTTKRLIEVLEDETSNNAYSLYFHNGYNLIQIFIV